MLVDVHWELLILANQLVVFWLFFELLLFFRTVGLIPLFSGSPGPSFWIIAESSQLQGVKVSKEVG